MHSGVFGTISWFFCITRLNNTGKTGRFHGNTGKYRTTKKIQEIQDTLWSLQSHTRCHADIVYSIRHARHECRLVDALSSVCCTRGLRPSSARRTCCYYEALSGSRNLTFRIRKKHLTSDDLEGSF